MSKPKRIYIAGPMTGHSEHNFPAFHEAANRLEVAGLEAVNPADNFGGRTDLPRESYLRADLALLASRSTRRLTWSSRFCCASPNRPPMHLSHPIWRTPPMNPTEILAAFQTVCALADLALSQYRLAQQEGRLTDEQKAAILDAAQLTDDAVEAARQRLSEAPNRGIEHP